MGTSRQSEERQPSALYQTAGASHVGKRQASIRTAVFWAGFFVFLYLTRFFVGTLRPVSANPNDNRAQWYGAVVLCCLTFGWTQLCARLAPDRQAVSVTLISPRSFLNLLFGLVFAAPLCAVSLVSLRWLIPGVRFASAYAGAVPILKAALLYILLAAYEELAFRGYPFARLLPNFSVGLTLAITSVAFIVYHLSMGWPLYQAVLGTGSAAVLFGMAALLFERDLGFPVGVHAGWNFVTWCLTSGQGFWKLNVLPQLTQRVEIVGMAMYILCMTAGVVMIWMWRRHRER